MNTEISFNYDDVLIAKDKDNGKEYYVIIEQDESCCDWIQDECPVGHLITWHRYYTIGDKHDYEDPSEFFKSLILEVYHKDSLNSEEGMKQAKEYSKLLLENTMSEIKTYDEVEDHYKKSTHGVEDAPYFICSIDENGDWWASYPLSTDKVEDMTSDDLGWMLEMVYDYKLSRGEMSDMIDACDQIAIFPVYMYDHGSIALSVSNSQYPFNDRWDSGQLGWWYITKEEAEKEWWKGDDWKQSFLERIKDYIEEFNEIESGNCWGFICAEKDLIDERIAGLSERNPYRVRCLRSEISSNQTDSCWGYIGDYEKLVQDYCSDQHLEITGVLE